MIESQNKQVEELQHGLTEKGAQEKKIVELQQSLQAMTESLTCQEEKTKTVQKELQETIEKLEKETEEKEKLQQNNLVRISFLRTNL